MKLHWIEEQAVILLHDVGDDDGLPSGVFATDSADYVNAVHDLELREDIATAVTILMIRSDMTSRSKQQGVISMRFADVSCGKHHLVVEFLVGQNEERKRWSIYRIIMPESVTDTQLVRAFVAPNEPSIIKSGEQLFVMAPRLSPGSVVLLFEEAGIGIHVNNTEQRVAVDA